jgi:hypothetical protein
MSDTPRTPLEQREIFRYAAIAGPVRGLDLRKRIPEIMRQRKWPHEDEDLVTVLCIAVGLKKIGAGRTLLRRPPGADGLGGLWAIERERVEARWLVEALELDELIQGR